MMGVYLESVLFAVLIIYSGFKLSQYGQLISQKRHFSSVLFGVIFLAIITSMPEVISSIASVTVVDAPNMAASDAIGSILFNFMILAVLDFMQGKGSILSISDRGHILTASLTIIMLGITALSIIQRSVINIHLGFFNIGYESILLILIYIFFTRTLYRHTSEVSDLKKGELQRVNQLWVKFAISAIVVIISGIFLAKVGKQIVDETGMSETFVGLIFLAIITSLPELIVSVSALKLGSIDMAIGNILGSNFFDTVIIPLCDVFYIKKQIISVLSISHVYTLSLCIVFSALVISGLVRRSKKSFLKLDWLIIVMLVIFALSIFFFSQIK